MPKMIPAHIGEHTKSQAEKDLFWRFQDMPDTDSWTILHSIGIAKHPVQSQGEADFVAVIPGEGTFTLEVKGGTVSFDGDRWHSVSRNGDLFNIKDPMEEANTANQALKDFVAKSPVNKENTSDQKLVSTVFGFGVIFPDCSFHGSVSLVDLADEQIADIDDCMSPESLKAFLLRLAKYWKEAFKNYPNITPPTAYQARLVEKILRPEFSAHAALSSLIKTVENRVVELTEEQFRVLENLSENERCIVKGYAGTGKTVLALRLADQKAAEDIKVGLFCYNRQLAYELERLTKDDPDLYCGSLTDYLERRKQEELPLLDYLILDEAQDLMRARYLDALDAVLKGGLKNGSWFFFMDAERQDLYHTAGSEEEVKKELAAREVQYTSYRLTENCRNSGAIAELIDTIFGTETKTRSEMPRGEEVHVLRYKTEEEELEQLNAALKALKEENIPLEKIVLLSPLEYEASIVRKLEDCPVTTDYTDREGKLLYSTIHAFKGLDSPVVIITDINHFDYESRKSDLYVAMSRAISVLCILIREKTWQKVADYIRNRE